VSVKSLKIGLVTGEYPPMQGGVGDFSRELALALAALGHDVHVITHISIRSGDFSRPLPTTDAQAVTTSVNVHPIIRAWNLQSLISIRRLARALSLDLINIQYQAAAYGMTPPIHFLPKAAGLPSVVTFHDLRVPYLFPKAGRLRRDAVTYLARSASGVIVTDPADEAELRRRGVERVTQIPIGSNIAPSPPPDYDRARWRARLGVGPGEFLLGYFGFLNPSKGGDTLIGALAGLAARKLPVKLVLIGGRAGTSDARVNEAFGEDIDKLIADYSLAGRILRTGFVDSAQVSAHLLACDALVLPYRDGVSFRRGTFMAALIHGCAIITTEPASPLPELRDGVNIRLVPPDSASAIVLAVSELLEAPQLRARLGEGARELAGQFTWDKIAKRTAEFFERVRG
jgi:glycosyltransferase involved in cell wall biosynthesis